MIAEQFGSAWQAKFDDLVARFRGPNDRISENGYQVIGFKKHQNPSILIIKYPGVSPDGLAKAQREICARMPRALAEFLLWSNGLKFGPLILYGTTYEMPQPISLTHQNHVERYEDQCEETVGLGAMTGYHSVAHYFLHTDGRVDLVAGHQISDVAATWPTYEDMVISELNRLSAFYDDDGMAACSDEEMLLPRHQEWEQECRSEAKQ